MVDKVTRVSSSIASTPTRVDTSLPLAEPEAAWVAHRQSAINTAYQQRKRDGGAPDKGGRSLEPDGDGVPEPQVDEDGSEPSSAEKEQAERLSGESERIGSGNLDEEVPFGQHLGYV